MKADGIPAPGDFSGGNEAPLGTHEQGRWKVVETLNRTVPQVLLGDRPITVFENRPATYDAMFRASVSRFGDREAVVCGARRLNYRELDERIERTASGFIARGLGLGDRVTIMLDNCLEYLVAVLAVARAGGIAIPLGTRLGPFDIAHIVKDAAPMFAVTAREWMPRFPLQSSIRQFLLVDDQGDKQNSFDGLAAETPQVMPVLSCEQIMMIIYTSGTTGKPKGACLTHVNFVHTALHYLYALGIDCPQRSLLVVPGTHIAGFGPVVTVTFASGGAIVLMREFKARAVLEKAATEKITYAVLVPTMYQLCMMEPSLGEHDLSRWRYGVYGGSIMPPVVIERVAERLPGLRLINAYGATETCAVCTIMPPELTSFAPASVGLPLHCDDILVVGENEEEVPVGQPGELWIRGPNVSPNYWNDPDATARAYKNGYWRSGDIGTRRADGLMFIHDRVKDMINRGGFKVFSAEVENALMTHPDVADCAVVGVPDPVLVERTFALVQRRNAGTEADTLRTYLRERIADYKVPDFWHVVDDPIPRNQNGKPQKADVRLLALQTISETRR